MTNPVQPFVENELRLKSGRLTDTQTDTQPDKHTRIHTHTAHALAPSLIIQGRGVSEKDKPHTARRRELAGIEVGHLLETCKLDAVMLVVAWDDE